MGQTYEQENNMTVNSAVMAMAGTFIIASVLLSIFVSQYWLAMTLFVGANLLQSAFTGLCPAATVFRRLGLKTTSAS